MTMTAGVAAAAAACVALAVATTPLVAAQTPIADTAVIDFAADEQYDNWVRSMPGPGSVGDGIVWGTRSAADWDRSSYTGANIIEFAANDLVDGNLGTVKVWNINNDFANGGVPEILYAPPPVSDSNVALPRLGQYYSFAYWVRHRVGGDTRTFFRSSYTGQAAWGNGDHVTIIHSGNQLGMWSNRGLGAAMNPASPSYVIPNGAAGGTWEFIVHTVRSNGDVNAGESTASTGTANFYVGDACNNPEFKGSTSRTSTGDEYYFFGFHESTDQGPGEVHRAMGFDRELTTAEIQALYEETYPFTAPDADVAAYCTGAGEGAPDFEPPAACDATGIMYVPSLAAWVSTTPNGPVVASVSGQEYYALADGTDTSGLSCAAQ